MSFFFIKILDILLRMLYILLTETIEIFLEGRNRILVSLKDISVQCGVSIATVSKALNNHKDVSAATKEKIHRIAKEMGYFPNSQARALKTNRTYNLGVMFLDEADSGLTHDFFSEVLNSFKKEAEYSGYDITFINKDIGGHKMSFYEHCRYRNVDGVLIACIDFKDPDVYEVVNGEIPVVTIDHTFDGHSCVLSDNRQGIKALFDYVYKMGHRKIALIQGNKSSVSDNRLIGFYKALSDYNIPADNNYIVSGEFHNIEMTVALTKQLINLPDPPTCIFMPDDISAVGGMRAIEECGLKIPDDISIVGYDGIRLTQFLKPPLTTYKQDTEAIGIQAARQLIALVENQQTVFAESAVITGRLEINESVKNIKG
ncbi:MAG: LacI family DNA-binding transcriptional regulator [Oscillospiraceae bacterium]|jgi:LacI family transcriptional regulator